MGPMAETCEHLDANPRTDQPPATSCAECVAQGLQWVALRRCTECGNVGCCDSSPGLHATAHHNATQHPVIENAMPGGEWRWCYVDKIYG